MTPGPSPRIVGIDPGSRSTGWAVLEVRNGAPRAVAWGVIRPSTGGGFASRLAEIKGALDEVLLRYLPTEAAVEDLFHAANARSALRLGEVRGAVLVAIAEAGLEVHAYAPAEVKKAVSGYGRADKDQVGRMVARLLGLGRPPTPSDAADALAVGICHVHASGLATAGRAEGAAGGYRHPPRG